MAFPIAPIPCPACNSTAIKDKGQLLDAVEFAGRQIAEPIVGGRLWRCECCTLWFRFPILSDENLHELYRLGSDEAWSEVASHRVDWILAKEAVEQSGARGSVLDIGCWDGRFLEFMADGNPNRYGVEMNDGAAARARARGVQIIGSDFAKLNEIGQKFDLITGFDVIEHVRNPLEMLHDCVALLRPGGLLLFATGNTESFPWRMLGPRHLYCIWPEHLSFISPTWCGWAASNVDIELNKTIPYRRVSTGLGTSAIELVQNLVYRSSPGTIVWLRGLGVGTLSHPIKAAYPPKWTTAKDHFLAIFKKPL